MDLSDSSSIVTLLLTLLLLNAALAAARSALVNARRPNLSQLREAGAAGAGLAERVAADSTRLLVTVRLGQALCRFLAAGLGALLLVPPTAAALAFLPFAPGALTLFVAISLIILITILIVVFGELVPETLVLRHPERWAIFFAPLVAALIWLFTPLNRLAFALSGMITGPLAGRSAPVVTEEEIKTMVDAGEEGGVIEEEEKEMIYSIFELGDTLARELMVPRIDIVALEADTPIPSAVSLILSAGHSRIPVYEDSIDNVLGLLYAKDLLTVWQSGEDDKSLRDLLRPAYFVPEAKKASALLEELQSKRVHMAIVVDEYGGVAGLVTMEDIVEEIVGEIRDEYDIAEEPQYMRLAEGEYLFDARMDLDDVNQLLKSELPKESNETLGGFIYGQLGKVPAAGEQVRVGGLLLEVVSVAGRRIRKVRARQFLAEPAPSVGKDGG